MRAAAISLSLGAVLLAMAGETQALGFGRVVNVSTLGQPLNFAATVRLENDEQLPRECVSAEVLSGDRTLPQGKPILDANKKKQIDPTACLPVASPGVVEQLGAIHSSGSGINPDFPVHCDPETFHCVIDEGKSLLPF